MSTGARVLVVEDDRDVMKPFDLDELVWKMKRVLAVAA
jgi:hypothetical protein